MSIVATNAEIVSNNWCLHPTGIRPNHAPSAGKRIPAGSCPPFPVGPAVQGATLGTPFRHPAVRPPAGSPERPDSQPCAVAEWFT